MLTSLAHWCLAGGRPSQARIHRWRAAARRILRQSEGLRKLSDDELLAAGRELQWKARTGVSLDSIRDEAYALVCEAADRAVGMRPYPVQLMAGLALFEGHIAEMQTGEGKTLTATLPSFIRALPGKGCHVITSNDYLAIRDAKFANRILSRLGISVACVLAPIEKPERREAYSADVTYGTVREMGFDFLRDRLASGGGQADEPDRYFRPENEREGCVQRGHHFALVDEADSVLIDEARTPLVIGLALPVDPVTLGRVRWCQRMAGQLVRDTDFEFDPERRVAWLTAAGCDRVALTARPSLIASVPKETMLEAVERALVARFAFERGRDYLIVEGKVVIVDESTGRTMEGRKWQEGLHQAIEAKEHLPITTTTGSAARITVQSFFRQYDHLAGMTGTAQTVRRELKRTYGLRVSTIPTHRPSRRQALPPRFFDSADKKRHAVADEVARLHALGRAILVGTPSVSASEQLGKLLEERQIPHQILNAHYHEEESEIIKQAGQWGAVTIATNMAGRGTDIVPPKEVLEVGGLHVIATEMHSSARIDRQLIGRSARQGDPGSYQFFLSLDDELFRVLEPDDRASLQVTSRPDGWGELAAGSWLRTFRATQAAVEAAHEKQRSKLLKHEEKQREVCERIGLDPWLELVE